MAQKGLNLHNLKPDAAATVEACGSAALSLVPDYQAAVRIRATASIHYQGADDAWQAS
jgi:hypothetical protein